MNNETFKTEILNYIEDCYTQFHNIQNTTSEIIGVLHDLFESNGIEYFLVFGSLLGAVRDAGQIPWDYDIDIAIPVTHKKRLIDVLDTQLVDKYYYKYTNNTDEYPTSCLRVSLTGMSFTAVHVDVFFLIGCPNDEKKRSRFIQKINASSYYRETKYLSKWISNTRSNGVFGRIISFIKKCRSKMIPKSWCLKEDILSLEYPLESSEYCYIVGDLRYAKCYKKEWFLQSSSVIFEKKELRIPIGYEQILTELYKDYSNYLPIKKRFEEFYNLYCIMNERNQK